MGHSRVPHVESAACRMQFPNPVLPPRTQDRNARIGCLLAPLPRKVFRGPRHAPSGSLD